jgi:dinuclear metal center YbgI/SA1388 family protein
MRRWRRAVVAVATVGALAALCDGLWPQEWAEPWDNVGLLCGAAGAAAPRCMVALDADGDSVRAAADAGCGLLLSHHPLPFRPLRRLTDAEPAGAALLLAAQRGVAIYAAHTNLDVAPRGTSAALADALGLRNGRLLQPTAREPLEKLVTFVPPSHADAVLDALAGAGAGHLGRYSHCSFRAPGTGTFLPLPGADPWVGTVGELHREPEVRLEVLVPASRRPAAVAALLAAHPYEEVAYDIVRLENEGPARGYGVVGDLPRPSTLRALAAAARRRLAAPAVRFVGAPDRPVHRVAVCGGAGVSCAGAARAAGADVLVTADLRYHEARDVEATGLALVDPGHQATEAPVVPWVADELQRAAAAAGLEVTILCAPPREDVWRVPGG